MRHPPDMRNGARPVTTRSNAATPALTSLQADSSKSTASNRVLTIADAIESAELGCDQRRKRRTLAVYCACRSWHLFRGLGERTAPCGRRYLLAADEAVAA